jgi:sugar phosphate isomerase/epimerase
MTSLDNHMTRRTMLARGIPWSAAALAVSRVDALLGASRARCFKIGACEWNLGRADPSSFDVAKKIGLDGVQINMGSVGNDMHLRKPEVQKAYLEAARKTGLGIGSLAIGEMNHVPLKRDPRAARWLDESIDVCKAMGIPIVMPACFGNGDLDMAKTAEIDHLVGVLRDVAPKAEKHGVVIGLESYLSAKDTMTIIERVGSPAMKMYYDVGNSTDKGYDIHQEIPLLGKLICEFHFKDGRFLLGQGRIDFRRVREALDKIDYSGWIQIEAAAPNGVYQDYAAYYTFLRGIFPEGRP